MTAGLYLALRWWRGQQLAHAWLLLLVVQGVLQWYLADGTVVSSLLAPSGSTPFVALTTAAAFIVARFLALAVLPALVLASFGWQLGNAVVDRWAPTRPPSDVPGRPHPGPPAPPDRGGHSPGEA